MDLFREARWTFGERGRLSFYQTIQDLLLAPRLPRYGILLSQCAAACEFVLQYRLDPESAGFPDTEPDPLLLFDDVGSLEFNDPCRICIEENYTATIEELYADIVPMYSYLKQHVIQARDASSQDENAREQLDEIAGKLTIIMDTVTKDDVADFYFYYVARNLYGELGVDAFLEEYQQSAATVDQCLAFGAWLGLTCPVHPDQVDEALATQFLLDHADNTFSSVNTFGAPTPLWSEPDGTGYLLLANNVTGRLHPVGGSGVNMSAPLDSMRTYLALLFLQDDLVDPASQEWNDMVETNPLYAWLMANLTLAQEGTGKFVASLASDVHTRLSHPRFIACRYNRSMRQRRLARYQHGH